MVEDNQILREQIVQIIEDAEAEALSTGVIRQQLKNEYDTEESYRDLLEFNDSLVDENVLEYHHDEYGEYTTH